MSEEEEHQAVMERMEERYQVQLQELHLMLTAAVERNAALRQEIEDEGVRR